MVSQYIKKRRRLIRKSREHEVISTDDPGTLVFALSGSFFVSREAGTVRGSLSQRKEDNSGSDGNGNKGVSPDVPEAVVFVSASVLLKPFCTLEHFKGWVKTGLRVCIQGLADNRPGSADRLFSRRTVLPPALKFPAIGFRPLPFFVPVLPAGR